MLTCLTYRLAPTRSVLGWQPMVEDARNRRIPEPRIKKSRLEAVRGLFDEPPHGGPPFPRLYLAGVQMRLALVESFEDLPPGQKKCVTALKKASGYSLSRFREVVARRKYLEWLRGTFANLSGDERYYWKHFAGLAIKDFHADVASLMDAVTPMIIVIDGELEAKHKKKPPSFGSLRKISGSAYHKNLQLSLKKAVDATEEWWPHVKETRDILIHRKHSRLVFSGPQDGFFFQLSNDGEESDVPIVTDPVLLKREYTNVADFELYSAWVIAEVIYFLDELGRLIAKRPKLVVEKLEKLYGEVTRQQVPVLVEWPWVARDIDRLLSFLSEDKVEAK